MATTPGSRGSSLEDSSLEEIELSIDSLVELEEDSLEDSSLLDSLDEMDELDWLDEELSLAEETETSLEDSLAETDSEDEGELEDDSPLHAPRKIEAIRLRIRRFFFMIFSFLCMFKRIAIIYRQSDGVFIVISLVSPRYCIPIFHHIN